MEKEVYNKSYIKCFLDLQREWDKKMLIEFKVRNYRNFRDELHFLLETGKNYEFNQEAVRNGVIKDSVVVGYNAAGKTNLGLAMMDLTLHLTDKRKYTDSNIFYSNLYNKDTIVSFVYKFKFDSQILEYTYEKRDEMHVLREVVRINGKKVIENNEEGRFVKLRGSENLNLEHWDESISFIKYIYANTILDQKDNECSTFTKFMKFVNRMLWISSTEGLRAIGSTSSGGDVMEDICNLEMGVEKLESFLHEAALDFKLTAKDKGEGKRIYCQMGGKEVTFAPLMSSGTRSLVFLFLWYMKRKDISFIFVDEFDAFYHTDLAIAVIRKLMAEEEIQVIFTSHNTDIISNELLRPDCYFVLNDNRILPFSSLTDKALREAHNLQKMYKAGAFHEQ